MNYEERAQRRLEVIDWYSAVWVWKKWTIFWFPFTSEEVELVLVPVPWDVTTSDRPGTVNAPEQILDASTRLDFFDEDYLDWWKNWVYLYEIPQQIKSLSVETRPKAAKLIEAQEKGIDINSDTQLKRLLDEVNIACSQMITWVQVTTEFWLSEWKLVWLIWGDHSVPLGFYQSLAKQHKSFWILHIDAHCDLREEDGKPGYEGFTYSHASIMANAIACIPQIEKIHQVWIRDCSEDEVLFVANSAGKVKIFSNDALSREAFFWTSWEATCKKIVADLPQKVHISFDIDGLKPSLCPDTGTPVAWGFEVAQIKFLLQVLLESGKQIIGFDLVEVSNGSSDNVINAKVGADVLKMLCWKILQSHFK